MKPRVIDRTTGKEPDLEKIALTEEWAKRLVYCDMEGFDVGTDGILILTDECGGWACCPDGRFQVLLDWGEAGHQEPGVVFQDDEFRVKGEPGSFEIEAMSDHDSLEKDLLEAVLTASASGRRADGERTVSGGCPG